MKPLNKYGPPLKSIGVINSVLSFMKIFIEPKHNVSKSAKNPPLYPIHIIFVLLRTKNIFTSYNILIKIII